MPDTLEMQMPTGGTIDGATAKGIADSYSTATDTQKAQLSDYAQNGQGIFEAETAAQKAEADARDTHFEKLYTDPAYAESYDNHATIKAAESATPFPNEVKYGSTNMALISHLSGINPSNMMPGTYKVLKDAHSEANFGKTGMTEEGFFNAQAGLYKKQQDETAALGELPGKVISACLDASATGEPISVPKILTDWKALYPDMITPENEAQFMVVAQRQVAEGQHYAPIVKDILDTAKATTRTQKAGKGIGVGSEGMDSEGVNSVTIGDVQPIVQKLSQYKPDEQAKILGMVGVVAKERGIEPKDFYTQFLESATRSFTDIGVGVDLGAKQLWIHSQINALRDHGEVADDGTVASINTVINNQSGNGLPSRMVTPEEKHQILGDAQAQLNTIGTIRLARQFVKGQIDPIKATMSGWKGLAQEAAYGGAGLAPYVAASVVPGAGGAALMTSAMIATANDDVMTRFPNLNPVTGAAIAGVSGVAQAALMGLTLDTVGAKLPATTRLLQSLAKPADNTIASLSAKIGSKTAINTAKQAGLFTGMAITQPLTEQLASTLGADMPGVNWKSTFQDMGEALPASVPTFLLLSLAGAGAISLREIPAMRAAANEARTFEAMGASEKEAKAIALESDPDKKDVAYRKMWDGLSHEDKQNFVDTLNAHAQDAQSEQASTRYPTLHAGKDENGSPVFAIHDSKGNPVYSSPEIASALTAFDAQKHAEATAPEVAPETPKPGEEPAQKPNSPDNPKADRSTTGIAQRVYEKAGLDIQPGKGISAEEQVQRGRDLLNSGADPQAIIAKIQDGNALTGDEFATVRAHLEKLRQEDARAQDIADQNLGNIDLHEKAQEAFNRSEEFAKQIKPAQTEAHKAFMAMQGETDVQTGSFTALKREATRQAGRDLTKSETATAREVSEKVAGLDKQIEELKNRLDEALSEKSAPKKGKGKSAVEWIDRQAEAARRRIKERALTFSAGVDPTVIADVAIIGASHIAHGLEKFADWSVKMIEEFGEKIKPHLQEIFDASKAKQAELSKSASRAAKNPVWEHVKANYIDAGNTSVSDMIHGTAQDLGISADEVLAAISGPKGKRVTDELYGVMSKRRKAVNDAKIWIAKLNESKLEKGVKKVMHFPFAVAVAAHAVVMGTHGGANLFRVSAWKNFLEGFKNQYKFFVSGAAHERAVQELEHSPYFNTFKRAGLAVDPSRIVDPYEKYSQWIAGKLGEAGSRSMDAIKVFRMAEANQIWESTPANLRTGDYAKEVAQMINHATGYADMKGLQKLNLVMFAAKLEASRWARIVGDPAKTIKTYATWNSATPHAQQIAKLRTRRAAEFVAVYVSSLAINQAFLSATGSDQKINFTDPTKSDWMSHKAGGFTFGFEGKVLAPIHLLAGLIKTSLGQEHIKDRYGSKADRLKDQFVNYVRGKLNPFFGIAWDMIAQSDFRGRPLPFATKKATNHTPKLTWMQYIGEHGPIPISGALEQMADTWQEKGMPDDQISSLLKALTVFAFEGTGNKAQPDREIQKK